METHRNNSRDGREVRTSYRQIRGEQKKKQTIKVNPTTMCSCFRVEEDVMFFPEHTSAQNIKTQ
jgi:NADH:ubiquinone oxidoreductase subunit E